MFICFSVISFIFLITLSFVDFVNEPSLDGMVQIKSKKTALRQGDGPLADNPCKCTLSINHQIGRLMKYRERFMECKICLFCRCRICKLHHFFSCSLIYKLHQITTQKDGYARKELSQSLSQRSAHLCVAAGFRLRRNNFMLAPQKIFVASQSLTLCAAMTIFLLRRKVTTLGAKGLVDHNERPSFRVRRRRSCYWLLLSIATSSLHFHSLSRQCVTSSTSNYQN